MACVGGVGCSPDWPEGPRGSASSPGPPGIGTLEEQQLPQMLMFVECPLCWTSTSLLHAICTLLRGHAAPYFLDWEARAIPLCSGPRKNVLCGSSVYISNLIKMCPGVLGPTRCLVLGREEMLPFTHVGVLGHMPMSFCSGLRTTRLCAPWATCAVPGKGS